MLRGLICDATSISTLSSRRSKILAASRGFMFSYIVTRPLKRAASASSFCLRGVGDLRFAVLDFASCDSMRFSAAAIRPSRISSSRARLSSSCAALLQPLEDGALGGRTAPAPGVRDHPAVRRRRPVDVLGGRCFCAFASLSRPRRLRLSAWLALASRSRPTEPVIGRHYVVVLVGERSAAAPAAARWSRAAGVSPWRVGEVEHLLRPGLLLSAVGAAAVGACERCRHRLRRRSGWRRGSRSSNRSAAFKHEQTGAGDHRDRKQTQIAK